MTEEERAILAWLQNAPPILRKELSTPEACIAAVRVGMDVFDYFGISVRPIAVTLTIFNKVAQEIIEREGSQIERGDPRADEFMREGYYAIQVGGTGQKHERRWDGHLLLMTANNLVDTTLGVYSRPGKDIALAPASFHRPDKGDDAVPLQEGMSFAWSVNDCLLVYHFYESNKSYRAAPDWRRWPSLSGKIIKAMKTDLMLSNTGG